MSTKIQEHTHVLQLKSFHLNTLFAYSHKTNNICKANLIIFNILNHVTHQKIDILVKTYITTEFNDSTGNDNTVLTIIMLIS